jgi:hypothetical protein
MLYKWHLITYSIIFRKSLRSNVVLEVLFISLTTVLAMAEASPLPRVSQKHDDSVTAMSQQGSCQGSAVMSQAGAGSSPGTVVENNNGSGSPTILKKVFMLFEPRGCLKERDDYSLYLFPPHNRYICFFLGFRGTSASIVI